MKKLAILVAGVAAISAAPAFAQANTTSDSFVVNATVTPTCLMEDVQDITITPALKIVTTAGSNALLFGNGSTQTNSNEVFLSCNDNNQMTITTNGPLVNPRGVTPEEEAEGFSDEIDFRVAANNYGVGTGNNRLYYATSTGNTRNDDPRHALHRQISFAGWVDYDDNRGFRAVAGTYSATAEVTVAIAP
ncbi:hypothetical protein [Aurantiacibacter zhengii]|nr:hypothetical protein [Aurantiacibacter zhengii]